MKKSTTQLFYFGAVAAALTVAEAFGQSVATPSGAVLQMPPAGSQQLSDFSQFLINSLGGLKGASALAIAAFVVQVLLKLLDMDVVENWLGKSFSDWSGAWKLVVISGLTLVSGVLGLMVMGHVSLGAALIHSTTLTAFMVFANQIYQHVIAPVPAPAASAPADQPKAS